MLTTQRPFFTPLAQFRGACISGTVAITGAVLLRDTLPTAILVSAIAMICGFVILLLLSFTQQWIKVNPLRALLLPLLAFNAWVLFRAWWFGLDQRLAFASILVLLISAMFMENKRSLTAFTVLFVPSWVLVAMTAENPGVEPVYFSFLLTTVGACMWFTQYSRFTQERRADSQEQLMTRIFDDASDAMLLIDQARSEVLAANRRCEVLFASDDSKVMLSTIVHNLKPHLGDAPSIVSACRVKALWPIELELELNNDLRTPVEIHARPITVEGRSLALISLNDISQRWQAEVELRRSEQLLSETQTIAQIGGWERDLESNKIFWTQSNYKLWEVDNHEDRPQDGPYFNFYDPDSRQRIERVVNQCLQSLEPFKIRSQAVTAKGRRIWVQLQGSVILEDGVPRYLRGTTQDITAQIEQEHALKRSERLLDETQRIAKVGGWERDLSTGDVVWTASSYELWELEPGTDMTHEESNYRFFEDPEARILEHAVEHTLHTGKPFEVRIPAQTAKGRRIFVAMRGSVTYANGEPRRLSGTSQDITEMMETQMALEEAKNLAEAAVESRTRFLANMSHEIRTPMNGIIGMASLLGETQLDSAQNNFVGTIRSAGETLLILLNDILDFAKIESGQLQLETIPFSLQQCIGDTMDVLAVRAAEKDIALTLNIAPEARGEYLGDSTRCRQVFSNLLNNAIKFTNSGAIQVDVRTNKNGKLVCSVSDTGIGIEKDKQQGLFDPFTQADASTTRRFGGTGLGLAICRDLIQRMGGEISVSSDINQGSTFHFTLDLQKLGNAHDSVNLSAKNIHLACTANEVVRALTETLSTAGALVTTDQELSMGSLRGAIPDVLIIDRRDHHQWQDIYRQHAEQQSGLPVLLINPVDQQIDPSELTSVPHCALLHHPVRPGQLLTAIENLIQSPSNKTRKRQAGEIAAPQQQAPGKNAKGQIAHAEHGVASEPATPKTSGNKPSSETDLSHLSVLLVEDNVVNRKVALAMLSKLGVTPRVAEHGEFAVAECRQHTFDIVLMDVQMPVMDGLTATRTIRSLPDIQQPYIVALTANAMAQDHQASKEAGMDQHLSKPLRLQQLRDLLRSFEQTRNHAA